MKKKPSSKKHARTIKLILLSIVFLITTIAVVFWWLTLKPNLKLPKHKQFFYIHSNDTYVDFETNIQPFLASAYTFDLVSNYMEFPKHLKAGRYTLSDGMNNRQLISLLRSGNQEPVKLVIRTYWMPEDLAHVVAKNLEIDSLRFIHKLTDSLKLSSLGFNHETAMCFLLPNTYYFNWNSNADTIINKLYKEYNKFWTEDRIHKASLRGLTKTETVILASIVWREIARADEMPRVAGVYLNRLKKEMLLQADPTLKFSLKEFDLRRILNIHMEVESPYNTYKFKGLPPGPICNPPAAAIDAVLNPEEHEYIYFCAQPGNTGYHNFATNLTEHNKNALLFHKYMNSLK